MTASFAVVSAWLSVLTHFFWVSCSLCPAINALQDRLKENEIQVRNKSFYMNFINSKEASFLIKFWITYSYLNRAIFILYLHASTVSCCDTLFPFYSIKTCPCFSGISCRCSHNVFIWWHKSTVVTSLSCFRAQVILIFHSSVCFLNW